MNTQGRPSEFDAYLMHAVDSLNNHADAVREQTAAKSLRREQSAATKYVNDLIGTPRTATGAKAMGRGMSDDKRRMLIDMLGPELAAEVIAKAEKSTLELEQSGIRYKTVADHAPTVGALAGLIAEFTTGLELIESSKELSSAQRQVYLTEAVTGLIRRLAPLTGASETPAQKSYESTNPAAPYVADWAGPPRPPRQGRKLRGSAVDGYIDDLGSRGLGRNG